MTLSFYDPESPWPRGEYIVLEPNGEAEADVCRKLGTFCVQHGWNAIIAVSGPRGETVESLSIIPKAAK